MVGAHSGGLHGSGWAAFQMRIDTGAGADSLGPVSTCEEHEQGTGIRVNRDKGDSPPTRQPCQAGGLGTQGLREWWQGRVQAGHGWVEGMRLTEKPQRVWPGDSEHQLCGPCGSDCTPRTTSPWPQHQSQLLSMERV